MYQNPPKTPIWKSSKQQLETIEQHIKTKTSEDNYRRNYDK